MGGWPPAAYALVAMAALLIATAAMGARWLNAVANVNDFSRQWEAIGNPSVDLSSENGNVAFQRRLAWLRGAVLLMLPLVIVVPAVVHAVWG